MPEDYEITTAYLPKLAGDFPLRGKLGEWSQNEQMMFDLPQNLIIGEDAKVTAAALTAIPTIWARPLLFQEALFSETRPKHPLHREVTREWRGLLGVIALGRFFGLDNWNIIPHSFGANSSSRLERVLYQLRPGEEWLRLYLIYLDGELVGGTSPSTFFFTPPVFPKIEGVFWQENGKLSDPALYLRSCGNLELLEYLNSWLITLLADTEKKNNRLKGRFPLINKLKKKLEEWVNELKDVGSKKKIELEPPLISDPDDLYSTPSRQIRAFFREKPTSHFLLKPSASRQPLESKVIPIVVWPDHWNDPRKYVWTDFPSNQVPIPQPNDKESGHRLANDKIKQFWIRPERYFLADKVVRIKMMDDVQLAHSEGYLPPLKSTILTYFEPTKIEEEIFQWGEVSESSVTVRLRVPLQDGRYATFSRVYSGEQILRPKGDPPIMAIWPNFTAKEWKAYFLLSQSKKDYSPFTFIPICPRESRTPEERDADSNKILSIHGFPEAFECRYNGQETIGLLFPSWGKSLEKGSKSWKVAVDFGTSNCTIATSTDDVRVPLRLTSRTSILTNISKDDYIELNSSFLPSSDPESTFPTIFRRYELQPPVPQAILDGVIIFHDIHSWASMYSLVKDNIVENIKWSFEPNDRKYLSAFIQQLLIMIVAEAVSKHVSEVDLYWSYPTAFSQALLGDLRGAWEVQKGWLEEKTRIKINLHSATESAAVCKYMIDKYHAAAGSAKPQVIIDVGGGTTDIAVWHNGKLAIPTSIRFAGNKIADLFLHNVSLMDALHEIVKVEAEAKRRPRYSHYNLVLRFHQDKILRALRTGSNVRREFRFIRSAILFMFNTIFYFTGQLLRSLSLPDGFSTDVYLAGNGSKFLEWLADQETITEIAQESVRRGSAMQTKTIGIILTEDPKKEVALGLLFPEEVKTFRLDPKVALLEQGYRLDGNNLDSQADLRQIIDDDSGILGKIDVPIVFPELKDLIKLNKEMAKKLKLRSVNKSNIYENVQAHVQHRLRADAGKNPDDIFLEPFFVLEAIETFNEAFSKYE